MIIFRFSKLELLLVIELLELQYHILDTNINTNYFIYFSEPKW